MKARDQSTPEQSSSTNVEIVLVRDEYPPTIDFAEYNETITENQRVDAAGIIRIQARDQDLKVTANSQDSLI